MRLPIGSFRSESIGNWQSTIGNGFAPTRYREAVLTPLHDIKLRNKGTFAESKSTVGCFDPSRRL